MSGRGEPPRPRRVDLCERGVLLDGEHLPLLAASVHYFRLSRAAWRPALEAVANLGARLVDTYVPWSVHERAQGDYDFGDGDPRKDVAGFVRLAGELGLHVIARPGPRVNSELTGFGIPHRVLWDERCQARSPRGNPVVLPALPQAFPVPSHASRAFFDEASLWLAAVSRTLAPLRYPDGPLVLAQIDNEGALYFRDGVFDQDYHPDAVDQYRRFLRQRYAKISALRSAHEDDALTFEGVVPPTSFDPTAPGAPARALDWAEFQEALVASALYRFRRIIDRNGLSGLPTFHNLPMAEAATPVDPARVRTSVDFVAADYYHSATPEQRRLIARRTTELAARASADGVPCYGAEMAAGFPPHFPPFRPEDNAFNVLCAMAYGLRGFNVYMAVGRDRWVGGPVRPDGALRDEAEFWTQLLAAFERTHFDELRRRVPVRIVIPRELRRWARIHHAFGPASAALFELGGDPSRRGAFDEPLAASAATPGEVEQFLDHLHDALERTRVPFGYVAGDLLDRTLEEARWTIVACSGWLRRPMTESLAFAVMGRRAVSVGPRVPERSECGAATSASIPTPENAAAPLLLPAEPDALNAKVDELIGALGLPGLPAEPAEIATTLHEDQEGKPRALFVINATTRDHQARVAAAGASRARDALTGDSVDRDEDRFALRVPARTVKFLELSPD